MRRLAAAVVIGLGLVAVTALSASAHNYIVSATPAEGETLTELPAEFSITTNENLLAIGDELNAFAMQITDADGLYYGDGCIAVEGPSLSTPASLGAAGDYTLVWQFVSADGHTVSGEYGFTWAPADGWEPMEGSTTLPTCGGDTTETAPEQTEDGSTDAENTASAPATVKLGDLLWIGGTVLAVLIAGAITVVVLTRKPKK